MSGDRPDGMDENDNWVGNVTLDNDYCGTVHLNDGGETPSPLCSSTGSWKHTARDATCKRCAASWRSSRRLLRRLFGTL